MVTNGALQQPGLVGLQGLWYRLARDKQGAILYRQRPAPFYPAQVSQADMGEAQVSPDGRLPYSFRDLSGGGGLAQQPQEGDLDRFDRCGDAEGEGLDATLTPEGPVILSGKLQAPAPAGTPADGPMAGVLWHGGWPNAYFAAGRYVYRFDGSAIQQVGDLGAGNIATDKITSFLGTGDISGTETWYQPCGYQVLMRYSQNGGTTWAPINPAGGVNAVQSAVEVDGEVVMAMDSPRIGSAMIGCFEDGGSAPTLFSVIDPIGDAAIPISRLMVHAGRVVVLKDREGIFLLDDARRTMEVELFPEFRGERLYYAGATVWRGLLWLPTSLGLFAIGPNFGLQKVGPMEGETSALARVAPRGALTAIDGDAHHLYAFRQSSDGPSWVYKANVEVTSGGVGDIAWFPWSQQADRAQCRVMTQVNPNDQGPRLLYDRVLPVGSGSPPLNNTAYTQAWYRLPNGGRDPRIDSTYRYAPAGTLYYSRLLARFPGINKAWYSLIPLCAPLERTLDGITYTTAQTLQTRAKLDSTLLTTDPPAYGYLLGLLQRSGTGLRDRFKPPLFGRGLDVGVRLATTDDTTTPQLYSLTIEYDLRPIPVWRHEMTLDLSSGAYSASGAQGWADPLTPGAALRTLRLLPGAPGGLSLVDPWANGYDVSIPVDGVSLRASGPEEVGYTSEFPLLVDVVCTEQVVRDQGTWGTVALYTWRQVSTMTWNMLPQLG